MSSNIPVPFKAVVGLASVTVDEARKLPRRLISLPIVTVGAAMQASLKAQQQYTALANRGDELLTQLTGEHYEEPPPWAQFEDDESVTPENPRENATTPSAINQPILPIMGYDSASIASVRAKLRRLDEMDVTTLLNYERDHANRIEYLKALENRLAAIRQK